MNRYLNFLGAVALLSANAGATVSNEPTQFGVIVGSCEIRFPGMYVMNAYTPLEVSFVGGDSETSMIVVYPFDETVLESDSYRHIEERSVSGTFLNLLQRNPSRDLKPIGDKYLVHIHNEETGLMFLSDQAERYWRELFEPDSELLKCDPER